MKAILVFVSTLDGKVTKWGDPHPRTWSSGSDRDYFKNFGSGGSFVVEENLDINLQLLSSERVNEQETLIIKYSVIKSGIIV